jgi:hypothetical protein
MKNKNTAETMNFLLRACVGYYLLLVSVIAVRLRVCLVCVLPVCARTQSVRHSVYGSVIVLLVTWVCVVCHLAAECCRVVVLVGRGLVLVRRGANSVCYFESVLNFVSVEGII